MKITHNSHGTWQRPSAAVSADYEAEVRRSTDKADRRYRLAQERLERAEAKLERARASAHARTNKKQMAELVALVELRRAELEDYRRMMSGYAASATHRGTKGYRPVPHENGVPF